MVAFLQLLLEDLRRRQELLPLEDQLILRAERLRKVVILKLLSICCYLTLTVCG